MDSRNTMMLGLGVAIALVISAGAAYGMMGQTARQQSAYSGGFGVAGVSGYGGGMMGGRSITAPQQGTDAGGVAVPPGHLGGMMGGHVGSVYSGGIMGGGFGGMMGSFGGMMNRFGGMMNRFGGMMSQFAQFMGEYWNRAQNANGTTNGAFVAVVNYGFHPANLTVAKGTTVTWVNMDFVQHTITAGTEQGPTNLFDSHELNHIQSFSYTFNAPGTYTYYCDIHSNMVGMVTVTA